MVAMEENTKIWYFEFPKLILRKILYMIMNWTCGEGDQMRSLKIRNKNNFKMEISCNFHKIQILIMELKFSCSNKNN